VIEIKELRGQFNTPEVFNVFKDCMYMATWETFSERALKYLDNPNIRIFGYYEDACIIGILAVEKLDDSTFEIRGIAVDAEYRKRGIGRTLINHVCEELSILTLLAETDGVEFYKHCGFETEGFLKTYPSGVIQRYKCTLNIK